MKNKGKTVAVIGAGMVAAAAIIILLITVGKKNTDPTSASMRQQGVQDSISLEAESLPPDADESVIFDQGRVQPAVPENKTITQNATKNVNESLQDVEEKAKSGEEPLAAGKAEKKLTAEKSVPVAAEKYDRGEIELPAYEIPDEDEWETTQAAEGSDEFENGKDQNGQSSENSESETETTEEPTTLYIPSETIELPDIPFY